MVSHRNGPAKAVRTRGGMRPLCNDGIKATRTDRGPINRRDAGAKRLGPAEAKPDRNAPCPCGSGVKAKRCHPEGPDGTA